MNRIKTALTATSLLTLSTIASAHAESSAPTAAAHVEQMNTLIFCAAVRQRTANSIKADDPDAAILLHGRADDTLNAAYAAGLKARDTGHLPGGDADIRRHVERLHMSARARVELLTPQQFAEKRDWCQRVVRARQ